MPRRRRRSKRIASRIRTRHRRIKRGIRCQVTAGDRNTEVARTINRATVRRTVDREADRITARRVAANPTRNIDVAIVFRRIHNVIRRDRVHRDRGRRNRIARNRNRVASSLISCGVLKSIISYRYRNVATNTFSLRSLELSRGNSKATTTTIRDS